MPQPKTKFTFLKEAAYSKALQDICKKAGNTRADDVQKAIEWGLERDPYKFPEIEVSCRYYKLDNLGNGFPTVIILFDIDKDSKDVILINIKEHG